MTRPAMWALLGAPVVSGASGQSFSDDFNRADSSSLGANWTEVVADFSIVSNTVQLSTGGPFYMAVWSTACDTDDNQAELTITDYGANEAQYAVARSSDSDFTCYAAVAITSHNGIRLKKFVSGTETNIGSLYSATLNIGDTIGVSVNGSTVKGYHNGTEVLSVTDTTISTGKYVGLGAWGATQNANMDDWSGGDL